MRIVVSALLAFAFLLLACAHDEQPQARHEEVEKKPVASPLPAAPSYYEQATLVSLEKRRPEETTGLHNVYRLSRNIVSGSEPHGEAALAHLKEMGIRTVLSVDGMPPEAGLAEKYGLRYVHIPIQYSGIRDDEIRKIAKTFTELEGPFYVHCFHGKHRGPAGAAIGRLVLDGVSREEALAEMRQWCGTSKNYEGLYRTIATAEIPDEAALASFAFDFPATQKPSGIVPLMAAIARAHDNVFDLMKNDFAADPDHPDVDALNEAKKLQAFLGAVQQLAVEEKRPDDYLGWAEDSAKAATELVSNLVALRAADSAALQGAKDAFGEVKTLCSSCHGSYRDH